MAEGLMRHYYGDQFECFSAGTEKTFVKPHAIQALEQLKIDTQALYSKTLEDFRHVHIDYVITVCDNAKEACPWFPANKELTHISFTDPSNEGETDQEKLEAFSRVRDDIKAWLDGKFGTQPV